MEWRESGISRLKVFEVSEWQAEETIQRRKFVHTYGVVLAIPDQGKRGREIKLDVWRVVHQFVILDCEKNNV